MAPLRFVGQNHTCHDTNRYEQSLPHEQKPISALARWNTVTGVPYRFL